MGQGCQTSLLQIRREVLAPYLALLSTPLRFSKQWLTQIASVAQQVGGDFIVAPSVDLEGAGHYVRYEGNGRRSLLPEVLTGALAQSALASSSRWRRFPQVVRF